MISGKDDVATSERHADGLVDILKSENLRLKQGLVNIQTNLAESNEMNVDATRPVTGANDRVFMSLAKLDHIIWKVNTYLSVIEREPAFDFVDCHNCRLGKWYYEGDGQSSFSAMPSYRSLEGPHAQVHEATRRVFDLMESELASDDDMISDALDQMERGSDGVFEYLDRILAEKKKHLGEK